MRRLPFLCLSLASTCLKPVFSAIDESPHRGPGLSLQAESLIPDDPEPHPTPELAVAGRTKPAKFESVWVRVKRDTNTECKLCPYENCSNKDWYGSSHMFGATCWTYGERINNTKYVYLEC